MAWTWERVKKGHYRYGVYDIAHEKGDWTVRDAGQLVGQFEELEHAKEAAEGNEAIKSARRRKVDIFRGVKIKSAVDGMSRRRDEP